MRSVVTFGETMALLRPIAGTRLELSGTLALSVGGAESNVAIGVTRLGGAAVWTGHVGDDELGRRILRELRGEGVVVQARVDDAPTGLMIKETHVGGATRVRYYRSGSAGSRLGPSDLDANAITAAGILHVTGITPALSQSAADAVDLAVDIATAAGVPVSFDVNHRATLWLDRDPTPVYRRLAARAAVIFAGPSEAELLVGPGSPREQAARLVALGPSQAILKLGSEGCLAQVDGAEHRLPAIPVPVVDTVGAGDAFVAGYLTSLLDGDDPATRLALGTRCGAFACAGAGDWESFPRRNELSSLVSPGHDPVIR